MLAWQVSTMKRISLYLPVDHQPFPLEATTPIPTTHLPFAHMPPKASAISNAEISSLSWNLRNSSPPCPVM